MEDYAAKMLLKTDAALREYVTGHVQYREAAVLAAFDELRRRGQPAPEEAALRPGLEEAAAAQRALEEAAEAEREQAAVAADPSAAPTGPALYSPITIVLFSLPFTLLAGGTLLAINLWRLDRKRALLGLLLFIGAYMLAGALALQWALPRYGLSAWYGPLFNLPAILAYVLWFWPRYVGAVSYRNRSWLPPLLVCFALLFGIQKLNNYLMQKQPKEVREQLEKMMPK
ncbi:hypothetical protein Q3A66_14280 [Hymenobacter sp. BT770]|uniref:hypothetical protein n=1 Tax=Hymenobacter sp. BT770 TaxID=2886942 RepID=UPI001D0FE50D|nr:hypothetical protein [Hymenobacter sp. BT770]MCC3154090.1 hypothetical protein [Hymenobacter sp. BT770]MDO3416234.1 hypothetical protein [Hymenobacter sp. BT770]